MTCLKCGQATTEPKCPACGFDLSQAGQVVGLAAAGDEVKEFEKAISKARQKSNTERTTTMSPRLNAFLYEVCSEILSAGADAEYAIVYVTDINVLRNIVEEALPPRNANSILAAFDTAVALAGAKLTALSDSDADVQDLLGLIAADAELSDEVRGSAVAYITDRATLRNIARGEYPHDVRNAALDKLLG